MNSITFISGWTPPSIIEIIGLLFLAHYLIYVPLSFLFGYLGSTIFSKAGRILKPKLGDWAVVTGASDGIGLEYSRQLAEKGYNILLLSRTESKLKGVAEEIQKTYPQCEKIDFLAVDFSRLDIYEEIGAKLNSLEGQVKVLVNNVGIMPALPEYFHLQAPPGYHQRLINVNISAATNMLSLVFPMMLKAEVDKKNPVKGVVINISSSVSHAPLPLLSTYSASKIYMDYLSKALATEYEDEHIYVQSVTPGMVDTNMASQMKVGAGSWMAVKTPDYVRATLKTVGNEEQTNGHPKHKILANTFAFIGAVLGPKTTSHQLMSMNKGIKEKAEKKVAPLSTTSGDNNNKV